MIKVNVEKLKKNLENKLKEEESKGAAKDPTKSPILKPFGPGKINFRAIPYLHNEDPTNDPFVERYYHYKFGGTFYCPKENDGQQCALCDYAWQEYNKVKPTGNKDLMKAALDKTAQKHVFVAGVIRGREAEGVKLLKFKTGKRKMSENHEKIWGWFLNKSTENWMDYENGYDMILNYKEPSAGQKKLFNNAPAFLNDIDLDRDRTSLGDKETVKKYFETTPNIDELYEPTDTAKSIEMLEKHFEYLKRSAVSTAAAETASNESSDDSSDLEVSGEELDDQKATMDKLKALLG